MTVYKGVINGRYGVFIDDGKDEIMEVHNDILPHSDAKDRPELHKCMKFAELVFNNLNQEKLEFLHNGVLEGNTNNLKPGVHYCYSSFGGEDVDDMYVLALRMSDTINEHIDEDVQEKGKIGMWLELPKLYNTHATVRYWLIKV